MVSDARSTCAGVTSVLGKDGKGVALKHCLVDYELWPFQSLLFYMSLTYVLGQQGCKESTGPMEAKTLCPKCHLQFQAVANAVNVYIVKAQLRIYKN